MIGKQVSDLLFERDYNEVTEMLTDYRKGEIQKRLDLETDAAKQMELMMEQAEKRQMFAKRGRKRRS